MGHTSNVVESPQCPSWPLPALEFIAIGHIVRHPATTRVSITLNWACNPVPFGSVENADGEAEADISSGSAAFFVANSVTWQQRHLA